MKGLLSAASVLLYSTFVVASNVIDLTPANFDEVILNSGKPALVEFFAPWCGHCKSLAPVYEQLADSFASQSKVIIAKVDADAHKDLGKRFGIQGFPTLKWFDGKSDTPEDYSSGRDLSSLTKFITEKASVRAKAPRGPASKVTVLTDSNFDTIANNGEKGVFVKFYAPWCGHCKSLAPIYEKVAQDFERDSHVVVAEIDCDSPAGKQTAEKYGIQGFPTLKYFPAGASPEPIDYSGGRTEEAIVAFINEHAGTHRLPGGGLNTNAGTIEILDDLIKERLPSLEGVYEDLFEAAEILKDKYAQYYVKVAKKISEKATYAEDEFTRLTKMVSKGGLNAEKLDDIASRQNILKRFRVTKSETPSSVPDTPIKDEL